MRDFTRRQEGEERGPLPRHIAIIMDGNGRWAEERGLPRIAGHRAGAEATREIVRACRQWGIEVLTLYTFSVENWRRPKREVSALMRLLEEYLRREVAELVSNDIQLGIVGRMEGLSPSTRQCLKEAIEATAANRGLRLNLALNYGGRAEIVDAVKSIVSAVSRGEMQPQEIDEESFSRHLYTADSPDPDLLVRTGGEMRISNFLLYQAAYAEFWVTPVFWPDFTLQDLREAVSAFQQRERRFGMTGEQRRGIGFPRPAPAAAPFGSHLSRGDPHAP